MSKATDSLRDHQEQLDEDGVMVGVSRQAVAETLKELEYAYRCIEYGFVHGVFDFSVLRTRASNHLSDLEDKTLGAQRALLENAE